MKSVELTENVYDFIPIMNKKIFVIHFEDYLEQENNN